MGMLQSETFMRALQADRTRDLERAARDHRLLTANADEARDMASSAAPEAPAQTLQGSARAARNPCGESTVLPA
jgi:hypothetical protein